MEETSPEFTVISNKDTVGEKSTNTEEEVVVTSEFVRANYAVLKNLMQEHEKAEKVQAATDEVLRAAEKAQFDRGFLTPTHKQKQAVTPTGMTSIRSAKWLSSKRGDRGEGKTVSTEPRRKVRFKSAIRWSDSSGKTRWILFEGEDGIHMYDSTEDDEGEEEDAPKRQEKVGDLDQRDSDLTGPFQRRTKSRFTNRIATAPRPDRLKMPSHVKTYNGLRDPDDHMNLFCAAAENHHDWTMPVWCHMFEQSLEGPTRLWFNSLPAGSIDSFDELIGKVRSTVPTSEKV